MALLASLMVLLIVGLLIARAVRQSRMLDTLTPLHRSARRQMPKVAVIVPARNEASNIEPCLTSLVAQAYPSGCLHVLAVDDESDDGTLELIAKMVRRNPYLTLLRSGMLNGGWTGKSQACWVGAQAIPADTEWLCFIDADMRAEPSLIASAVDAATHARIDLLSLAPRHRLISFAERLMIPCGLYLLGFRQNLARLQAEDSKDATATGQFLLIRREAYENVGGHAAVSAAICEDVELARRMKGFGYFVRLMNGARLISTRMYTGWRTLWPGFTKNVSEMLGGPGPTLTTAAAAIVISWAVVLLPVVDYASCQAGSNAACAALALATPAALAAVGLHVAGAFYFGIPFWYGLLFPLGYTVGAFIALDSVRQRIIGQVRWKGRAYP